MDPSDALDVKQIFFTNLMLLGFDPTTMEKKWRILFNKDMFDLPNKKAFEVVMYFLFERLSPTKCRNEFRDCWPVQDKKSEHEFRKVCNNWLMQISKEETDAHLPRIIASTFFAPGGAKFYQLLFCFSKFVLIKVMAQEHGLRQREFLRPPVLTPSTVEMSVAMERTLECATICSRRAFLKQVHQTGLAQEQWRQCAGELVKEYRSLKKKNHDKEQTIRRQAQQAQEAHNLSVSGSPMGKSRKGADLHKFDFDIESIQRAQMLQKVREMWKAVEGFVTGRGKDREVVSAVLSDEDERCTVDARHMNVRVPDMLLRTCEREIQRRNVDNIYDGGKLNLLSLVQLSNLCLHLFIEKLHQVGLPDLDDAVPEVTAQLHRHQVHLANTRELEKKVEMELIPVIKASIKELKERLDTEPASKKSPAQSGLNFRGVRHSATHRSRKSKKKKEFDLQLTAPTPPVNFDPTEPGDTFGASFLEQLSKPLDSVSTPDAAVQLMTSVRKQVLSDSPASSSTLTGHHLAQGRPVYAPNARITDQQPMNTGRSRLPMRKSQSTDSKKGQPIVGVSQKRSATGGETRRQPCGDDAPTQRLVHYSTTFTETQWNLVDGAKQRLHDHKTPPLKVKAPQDVTELTDMKSSQEVRSSSDSNDSFLEWLSSSGRLTLTGSAQTTEGATDLNPLAPRISEGFITTSTPHSNNVFNLTPSHETTPPRSSKTPGATPTHVATPTHKTTPTHSATPTHRATPTQGVTRQAWSDVGRGHVLDVNQNNVSQDAHSDPVVTTLFTGEHPGEDLRSAGSHDNVPKPSNDQQIDALVDRVMSDSGLRSFFTGDRTDHADQLTSGGGVHSQSLSRESSMASSKGHDSVLEHNGREHFSPSTGQEIRDELVVRNGGAEKGERYSFLEELINGNYGEEQREDAEEEFPVELGEQRVIEVQDGSFSEFYVKTPSKTRPGEEEQTNRDIQLTLSSLKQRMMQMESHMVSDGEVASRLQNGNSTMDAGHKFEQTARASSDIGNLIARYQQLRANTQEVTSSENGQLRVPNTPPNSHTDSRSPVGLSPLNSTGTPSSTLSTPSKPPQPATITAADHAIRGNSFSELEVSSWPTSRMERRVDRGSDHASVATAPADLSDRYNYDSLISLSESLREKTAALRDNATRQAEHSNVSHSSLLLDDDFSDIQEQLQNMSPYSRSPSPGRLSAGESRNQTAYKRPELTIGLSATPMSPLMSSLHQVDGLGADDILDEHDSILLPTSPPADNPTSPNTGCLIDLSF